MVPLVEPIDIYTEVNIKKKFEKELQTLKVFTHWCHLSLCMYSADSLLSEIAISQVNRARDGIKSK